MCIPGRGLGLSVSEQPSNNVKTEPLAHQIACIGVAQVVKAEFFQSRGSAERFPELLDVGERLAHPSQHFGCASP